MEERKDIFNWMNKFFSSRAGIIFVGAFIGIAAAILQNQGNPGNMGFCVACFLRDIAGALGLHRAGVVQYLRPEIIGIVLGSMMAALMFKEYKARTGSAPIVRFVLGFFATVYFGWLPLYLPELFPTRARSTGTGVTFNFGRVATALGVLGSGQLMLYFNGDYAMAGRVICLVYLVGMAIVFIAPDTSRRQLED